MKRAARAIGLGIFLALTVAMLVSAPLAAALETVTTFAADCATPKTVFQLGETVCARVANVPPADLGDIYLQWVAPSGTVAFGSPGTTLVTTDPQTFLQALPTSGAGAELGRWQAQTATTPGDVPRVAAVFRVPRMSVIGVHRDSPGSVFFFRNSNTTGFGEGAVGFGLPGDVGLVGDWDGDGVYTPGVYRPSEGTFYLANSPVAAEADLVIAFGPLGGTPVVGDWNGDGTTTIGIHKDDIFHLRNSNTPGPDDLTFQYGLVGDVPVVGDWDGDGLTTVGVYRGDTFYLRNSNSAGAADLSFAYGLPGDTPIAGNWTAADGKDTIGIYRSSTAIFYLRNSNTEGVANLTIDFGLIGDQPAIIMANEAPVVVAGGTLGYTENQAATAIDPTITLTDMDSAMLVGATAQITGNCASGQDVLGFTTQNGISGVYTAATCLMTLSGRASVANYLAALQSVTYQNSSNNPSILARTVTWQVNDGAVVDNLSNTATSTITVGATSDAPVLTAGATIGYTEGDPATVIDNTVTVNDADSTNLTQATVQITGNYQNGSDVLACPAGCGGLNAIFAQASGTLTLSNAAPLATYQAALRTVTYENTSNNPTATGATRTVTWIGNDGTASSTPVTSTINITAINSTPAMTAGGTLNYTENQAATAIDGTITVTDAENGTLASATAQITTNYQNGQDVLSYVTALGITGNFDTGSGTLTLTGPASVGDFQTALRNVRYHNTSDNPNTTARTVTWQVNDGAAANNLSNTPTSTINVAAVNDAPVVTAGAVISFNEGDAAKVVDNGILITDADSTTLTQATAVISGNYQNGSDVLACPGGCNGLTGIFNATNGTLTINGTTAPLATYEAAMRLVTFHNNSENPTATGATRTITWQVNDGAAANNLSNTPTSTINITGVNDAPVLTAGAAISFTEGDAAKVIDNTVTITDPDSTIQSATVQITGNCMNPEDVLGFANNFSVTNGGYVAGTCTLTLNGPTSPANFQLALRSVTYFNGSNNPSGALRTVTWQANDGAGANNLSNTPTSTINVIPVNDAPDGVTDKAHAATGNVRINVNVASGDANNLLNGVTEPEGQGLVAELDISNASQGTAVINANGTYTYNPPPGFTGADTVKFRVCDNQVPAACSAVHNLNITVSNMLWFIDNNAPPGGNGRLTNPFNTIAAFTGVNDGGAGHPKAGEVVFIDRQVAADYVGTLTLLNNQKVLGKGSTQGLATFAGITLAPHSDPLPTVNGTAPNLTTTTGTQNVVNVASGNTLRGFAIGTRTGVGLRGNGFGTLTITEMVIGSPGQALSLTTGTLSGGFGSITSTSAPNSGGAGDDNTGNNVLLTAVATSGTFDLGSGSLSGAAGSAFRIDGQNGTFTYSGTITNVSTLAVDIANKNGGGVTLSGDINPGGAAAGISAVSNTGGTTLTFSGAQKKISVGGSGTGVGLTNNTGSTVTFSGGGLAIDTTASTATAFFTSDTGNTTVNVSGTGNTITGSGQAIIMSTSGGASAITTNITFDSVSSSGGFNNISLGRVNGTVTMNGGTLSGSTVLAVDINRGTASITYAGSFNTPGRGINVTNKTAGTVLFSGGTKTLSTGTNAAVSLATNGGTTITFSNGGLGITTTAGTGFSATGGATAVNVTGTGNSINAGSGTALNVVSTTIGGSGLTFQSISSSAGANNGIHLSSTGTNAGLTVTGLDGGDAGADPDLGSGGTINGKTGADGSTTSGSGVFLNNVKDISLNGMNITNHQNYGIRGVEVDGFRLTFSLVGGVNGTNEATPFNEGSISFIGTATTGYGLRGSVAFLDNEITGGFQRNVSIDNATGTMNLNFLRNNVHHTSSGNPGDDGFAIEVDTSAVMFANVSDNTFTAHRGDHFNLSLVNNANADLTFKNNNMQGGAVNPLGQGVFILGASYNGTFKYDISDNGTDADPFTGNVQGGAIVVNKGSGTATFSGQIKNNVIGDPAVVGSGSAQAFGIVVAARGTGGSHTSLVDGNKVRQYFDRGILLEAGGGTAALTAAVINNTVSDFADPVTNSLHGIHVDAGFEDGGNPGNNNVTLDIRANLVANAGAEGLGGSDIRVFGASPADMFIAGASTVNSAATADTFITGQNPNATSVAVSGSATWNNGPAVPLATPNLPTLPPAP